MTRTKALWISLGIIFLIFIFNQWMSKEIDQPPQIQLPAGHPVTDVPAQTPTALPLPQLPQDQDMPQATENIKQIDNSSPRIGERILEPVYEPPTNDVILVE